MIAIEEFGYNIKFIESERKNESQFALLMQQNLRM